MSSEDYDWIFDFVLQFLESDKFDAAVMDFVDEKCWVFDSDEENKFIYTDIHKEFKDHLEALISSNLGELGITPEIFFDSCEKGRNNRDINRTVFERMIAMDDFQTFKKIMVKRNVELQLEAMQSFPSWEEDQGYSEVEAALIASRLDLTGELPDPEELRTLKASQLYLEAEQFADFGSLDDEKVQELLRQSLIEMELMHRREELEQAELEQAVAISLALEEERLRLLYAEAKKSEDVPEPSSYKAASSESKLSTTPSLQASAKQIAAEEKHHISSSTASVTSPSKADDGDKRSTSRTVPVATGPSGSSFADPKPLGNVTLKPIGGSKALPPIGQGSSLSAMSNELEDKRRLAAETLRMSQKQLGEQRKQEDELRSHLNQVDPDEAERRAKHMRDQRDRIIAQKKAERERKVREEEESLRKTAAADEIPEAVARAQARADQESKQNPSEEDDEIERKRSAMRMALARRMKLDLIESEETKLAQLQEDQFSELDRKLRQVEQLRSDNKKRESVLSEQLRKQQANIARNVQKSAAAMREEDA